MCFEYLYSVKLAQPSLQLVVRLLLSSAYSPIFILSFNFKLYDLYKNILIYNTCVSPIKKMIT